MNELKEFKNAKRGLLKKLVGHGSRKEKPKDLSLGSESSGFEKETVQNIRVLERLLDDARGQEEKMESLGLPLEVIREELFSATERGKKYVVEARPQVKPDSPLRAHSPPAALRAGMSPGPGQGLQSPRTRPPRPVLEPVKVTDAEAAEIQQDPETVSPVGLSPIKRGSLQRRRVVQAVNSQLNICEYPELPQAKEQSAEGQGMEYLPHARTRANPNARGGAIIVEPHAPSARLDRALQYNSVYEDQKQLSLYDLLMKLGIEKAETEGSPRKVRII